MAWAAPCFEIPKALPLLGFPEGNEGSFQGLCPLPGPSANGLRMLDELAHGMGWDGIVSTVSIDIVSWSTWPLYHHS